MFPSFWNETLEFPFRGKCQDALFCPESEQEQIAKFPMKQKFQVLTLSSFIQFLPSIIEDHYQKLHVTDIKPPQLFSLPKGASVWAVNIVDGETIPTSEWYYGSSTLNCSKVKAQKGLLDARCWSPPFSHAFLVSLNSVELHSEPVCWYMGGAHLVWV